LVDLIGYLYVRYYVTLNDDIYHNEVDRKGHNQEFTYIKKNQSYNLIHIPDCFKVDNKCDCTFKT